jgi:3-deoxy-manno-octulosonate cytidylyltransferase (CMP-KDO synthetase)
MIQRVYEQASLAKKPSRILVATDHQKVYEAVEGFGGNVMMTSPDHPTGTDRLAEVAGAFPDIDIVINVQGDEPLIAPEIIDNLAAVFADDQDTVMATIMTEMEEHEYNEPSAVKVVTDQQGYALYFSRSLIPFPRVRLDEVHVYKHVGIYAYRREFLLKFASLAPTPLERAESLEQLRALENGYRIKVLRTDYKFVGVDTEEDLIRVNQIFKGEK